MGDLDSKYGLLLTDDIKLHRNWFKEMCKLIGIKVIYRAPRPDKHYTTYAEIDGNYEGALFIIPSGIDKAKGRLFRVSKISNIMVYPASITCEIVPEYENTYSNSQSDFKHNSFTLLNEEEGY